MAVLPVEILVAISELTDLVEDGHTSHNHRAWRESDGAYKESFDRKVLLDEYSTYASTYIDSMGFIWTLGFGYGD